MRDRSDDPWSCILFPQIPLDDWPSATYFPIVPSPPNPLNESTSECYCCMFVLIVMLVLLLKLIILLFEKLYKLLVINNEFCIKYKFHSSTVETILKIKR